MLLLDCFGLRQRLFPDGVNPALQELDLELRLFLDDPLEVGADERVHFLVLAAQVPQAMIEYIISHYAILLGCQVILERSFGQTDA